MHDQQKWTTTHALRLRMMVLSLLAAALGAAAAAAEASASPPNVLIVLTDDQGWGDTGYNCGQPVRAPAGAVRRFASRSLPSSPQRVPVAGQRRLLQAQHHRVPTNAAHRRACDGPTLCAVSPLLLGRWRLQPDSRQRADRAEQQAQLQRLRATMRPHGHRGRRLLAGAWPRQDRIHRRQGRRQGRDGHHAPRKGARKSHCCCAASSSIAVV